MSIIDQFRSRLGHEDVMVGDSISSEYLTEWRGEYQGDAFCAVRPESTQEVQFVVQTCTSNKLGIVPQGGNTGLCGGAIPSRGQVLVLMDKMNRIRSLDRVNMSISLDAGVTLLEVCKAAAAAGLFFPMRVTPWERCQVGGLVSTNAGGLHTVYCGSMRNLVLGLEVVLCDGNIWDGMKALYKNNEGYDLKHFFIGAEGTLGVITGAVLKLTPRVDERPAILFQCDSIEEVMENLKLCSYWDNLLTFEVMNSTSLELVNKHGLAKVACPPWAALVEFRNFLPKEFAGHKIEKGDEWHKARLNLSLAQKMEGKGVKSDISMPISAIPSFLLDTDAKVAEVVPGFRSVVFGHFAEGNLHYNPMESSPNSESFKNSRGKVAKIIQDQVERVGGSITGEHGIGMKHLDFLAKHRGDEACLMKKIRAALSGDTNFNPGKVTK